MKLTIEGQQNIREYLDFVDRGGKIKDNKLYGHLQNTFKGLEYSELTFNEGSTHRDMLEQLICFIADKCRENK